MAKKRDKKIPIKGYGLKPYSTTPNCLCYTSGEATRAIREITMITDVLALGAVFDEACARSHVCDIAKPWFAALFLTNLAAAIAGAPRSITTDTRQTKDEITKTNYAIRVALDDIVDRATRFLEERSKEMIE